MPAPAEEAIRAVSALATQLGNQISVHMLNYISTTKDLPSGFRDLSHTFLDTCRTLWAIEAGVTELASANRALPEVVINEVEKKFITAYGDFQQLEKLILKLVQYEHRGTWGKLQRGLHRPGQELTRIHESLKKTNETLQISGMAFHWSLGEARPEESVGIGYASLAAALDRIAKGRSAMAINKVNPIELDRSSHSTRSSPSVPPKDSPLSQNRARYTDATHEPRESLSQEDPNSVADDMSSILSLNTFLVSHSGRETERSPTLEYRQHPPRQPKMSLPSTSVAEVYTRQNSESSHNPNLPNPQGKTPLLLAVEQSFAEEAQMLLKSGADPNQQVADTTILIHAIRGHASTALIEVLLSAGCDSNKKDNHGKTALCEAVQTNQPDIVTVLLDHGANPNLPGPEHALWSAVYRHDCLRILLARGADIHKTPGLMEQATSVNSIDAVRVLLQAGVSPNLKKDGIYTPLCSAIRDDRPDIITLLLHHGADPNLMASEYPAWKCITHNRLQFLPDLLAAGADLKNPPGIAECAIEQNNFKALHWLVEQGKVDLNARNLHGHTAITTAIRENRIEMLKYLLANGADPNLRGQDWPIYMATKSPALLRLLLPSITNLSAHKGVVEKAVQANQLESIKLLLAAGASAEWKNGGVFSPLTTALREQHSHIVHYLLDEGGADPNAPGEHLPIVKAIRRCPEGDFSMIELLLSKGADPNKCYRDWNAIMQAIEDRHLELLQLLIAKGGPVDFEQKDETGRGVVEMAETSDWPEGVELLRRGSRV
ncbi:ankyrin repeat-containing domain protein [Aspergillus karnatakaensis]|uniref:ankyrin repeat domain-containing protein n=1 Tax=Aspergillus karnatakaensis TaxID=1810916 RepID=UPI003CCDF654